MSPRISPILPIKNRLLASLSAGDYALIQPHLEPVTLEVRTELERPDVPIAHLYFPESGIASVVATTEQNIQVEVGLIGSEGVSGLAVILGSDRSPHRTFMQASGGGHRMATGEFQSAFAQSVTLRTHFLRYSNTFTIQVAHTAAANARGSLEQKLARWILMARDRLDNDEVPLTHEFMAIMLGVRRAGVTEALSALLRQNLIGKGRRGMLVVTNRKGLEKIAGRFYGAPEREYKRLMAGG
jgi:CRP-like cAMP-binding protein